VYGADIFVDQAVEDGFSADLLCAEVGHGRGVSVGFVSGELLGECPDAACGARILDLGWAACRVGIIAE
jgi:hypothetical protein